MRVKEGGSLGDIYGNAFRRNEDGSIMVDETSKRPLGNTGNTDLLGHANPDFTMGWSNTLTYKNLALYFLIDFRFGGEVMSLTQSEDVYKRQPSFFHIENCKKQLNTNFLSQSHHLT